VKATKSQLHTRIRSRSSTWLQAHFFWLYVSRHAILAAVVHVKCQIANLIFMSNPIVSGNPADAICYTVRDSRWLSLLFDD